MLGYSNGDDPEGHPGASVARAAPGRVDRDRHPLLILPPLPRREGAVVPLERGVELGLTAASHPGLERLGEHLAAASTAGQARDGFPTVCAYYSLESLVRKFVKTPVVAYKPKKGGETDPEIAPILERGMRYVNEFASADAEG